MPDDLSPIPNAQTRKTIARRVRHEALELSNDRSLVVEQKNNAAAGNALKDGADDDAMIPAHDTYTKGLVHDDKGRVRKADLKKLISAIDQDGNGETYAESPFPGTYDGVNKGRPAVFDAPLYDPAKDGEYTRPAGMTARGWESPIAGHTFDLEGADADQVAMPPAPAIGSDELTAEMAEVYGAALIRDVAFDEWDTDGSVGDLVKSLNALDYFGTNADPSTPEGKRRIARVANGETLTHEQLFRGSTPGAKTGPYISQFMYLGNEAFQSGDPDYSAKKSDDAPEVSQDGLTRARKFGAIEMFSAASKASDLKTTTTVGNIRYGIQGIPQAFPPHKAKWDHMVEWETWLDVQNAANRKEDLDLFEDEPRFIATPRDLATYVHYDALYQAYLNACLLLLGAGAATDAGLPEGKGSPNPNPNRDGFALFGGPHILTLVCEVATRALKAVRRQKYNIHLRARPEALAAAVALAKTGETDNLDALGNQADGLKKMAADLAGAENLLANVIEHNKVALALWENANWPVEHGPLKSEDNNALLPMAFPEGSPMHPAYGAGHATVAGACVTILKAFFEMYQQGPTPRGFSIYEVLDVKDKNLYHNSFPAALFDKEAPLTINRAAYDALSDKEKKAIPFPTAVLPKPKDYKTLEQVSEDLSIQGELDKLAANISIGRNFAGVHYYTDYFESLRMGERIAVSILQEQMLTYREPVSMRLTSFDGDHIMIVGTGGTRNQDDARVLVWDDTGNGGDKAAFDEWWSRHAG